MEAAGFHRHILVLDCRSDFLGSLKAVAERGADHSLRFERVEDARGVILVTFRRFQFSQLEPYSASSTT